MDKMPEKQQACKDFTELWNPSEADIQRLVRT